jgi:predicted glycogen debranching enzyme
MEAIILKRSSCDNLAIAEGKEWLVTNGIGGYAAGTVANLLTRRYHGLLIAALQPPLGRTLLLAKLDETVTYDSHQAPLFFNRWSDGSIAPDGYIHIEQFHLEGTIPTWTFAISDALLEKRIWMQPGANTTYIQYRLVRATAPLSLAAKALVNYRDHHSSTQGEGWNMQVEKVEHGLRINAFAGAVPYQILCDQASVESGHEWYRNFELSLERYRGLGSIEDHLLAGDFQISLEVGQSVTFIASSENNPNLDGDKVYSDRRSYENNLLALAPAVLPQLCLAADQFIARRRSWIDPDGKTILAGYPWFGDWGRDTMISLPGLTLATGRPEIARSILLTFLHHVNQGMLPNRFPDASDLPEYNTVDATLWYFEAIRAYVAKTNDLPFLEELYPILEDIIEWHIRGTRYQIHMDPLDGLLYAGEDGVQLTWMDAKVGNWVVTPRMGKPVEINALWYNALSSMADFARQIGKGSDQYDQLAIRVKSGFVKFWNKVDGYLFDVIDSPVGVDGSLRPNQLFAVSLTHSPLDPDQQKAVVDVCARHLLTSHGLRSLSPQDAGYIGHYGGDMRHRDAAYHQGTVWGWLIGPFVSAHLRVYHDENTARSFLTPLLNHLSDHGLGSVSEIFDGDPPFSPRGCFAQAWSVAEMVRTLAEINTFNKAAPVIRRSSSTG